MIYEHPGTDQPLSQGDLICQCPLLVWQLPDAPATAVAQAVTVAVTAVVLTQACDLAQSKSTRVVVAVVHRAQHLVERGILKPKTIRDQIRTHRVYGWYFLPSWKDVEESIVDLRDLHTIPRAVLEQLVADGKRIARIATPYREHMAQHFANTYCRIALPEPYETESG